MAQETKFKVGDIVDIKWLGGDISTVQITEVTSAVYKFVEILNNSHPPWADSRCFSVIHKLGTLNTNKTIRTLYGS